MFNAKVANYPATEARPSYFENVIRALIALGAAILAIAPMKSEAASSQLNSGYDRLKTTRALYRLANDYEKIMPNQAAELRQLAGRD